MRICCFAACVIWLTAGVAPVATAQGPARADPFRSGIVALGRLGPGLAPRVVNDWALDRGQHAPAAQSADRGGNTGAEKGALIGGLTGVIVGGLGFAHFTHRNGAALNNGTGTLGGSLVGAGLVGGIGAFVGFVIGSAASH
jgi:hypothetical protein